MSSNELIISEVMPSIKVLQNFLEKENPNHFGCSTMTQTLKNKLEKTFTFVKNENKEMRISRILTENVIQEHFTYFIASAVIPQFKSGYEKTMTFLI